MNKFETLTTPHCKRSCPYKYSYCAIITCFILATNARAMYVEAFSIHKPSSSSALQLPKPYSDKRLTLNLLLSSEARARVTVSMTDTSSSAETETTTTAAAASSSQQQEQSSSSASKSTSSMEEQDDEIARLKAMAQKLRSEAAKLEAEQAEERAETARLAFEKFDTNPADGKISIDELKAGLEKTLKTVVPDDRVEKLMDEFDVSGDGYLQLDEMVSVDQFRNKLEAYAREEKRLAREAAMDAEKEKEMARLAEAKLEILNEKEPTQQDKIFSVLPYLFPLLDSLQFGRFVINENSVDNPLVGLLAVLYIGYRSIPFSGFLAFLALNTLSSNPRLNRLVRFNMQQAIFLDIALFFPGLLSALVVGIGSVAGFQIDESTNQLVSTVIFGFSVLTVLYASTSSLLGISPNKIPFISQAVEDRMPTMDMFDEQGRFVPRDARTNNKNSKDNNKEEKKESDSNDDKSNN